MSTFRDRDIAVEVIDNLIRSCRRTTIEQILAVEYYGLSHPETIYDLVRSAIISVTWPDEHAALHAHRAA